jgi:hypothetical protein
MDELGVGARNLRSEADALHVLAGPSGFCLNRVWEREGNERAE